MRSPMVSAPVFAILTAASFLTLRRADSARGGARRRAPHRPGARPSGSGAAHWVPRPRAAHGIVTARRCDSAGHAVGPGAEAGIAALVGGLLAGPVYLLLWFLLGVLPSASLQLMPEANSSDALAWIVVLLLAGVGGGLAEPIFQGASRWGFGPAARCTPTTRVARRPRSRRADPVSRVAAAAVGYLRARRRPRSADNRGFRHLAVVPGQPNPQLRSICAPADAHRRWGRRTCRNAGRPALCTATAFAASSGAGPGEPASGVATVDAQARKVKAREV
jgi:hypothetical protein